jgi:hypothetical protein
MEYSWLRGHEKGFNMEAAKDIVETKVMNKINILIEDFNIF